MEEIRKALAAQEQYLRCYGRPTEADFSLNDINRDLIRAMKDYYGQVSVGSFNDDTILAQYDGQKIYNSAYDFCVPGYDEQLEMLLRQWRADHKICQLNAIQERIQALNGQLLLWV